MSYLLDKKNKKRKIYKIIIGIIVLFLIFYFWSSIFYGLSSAAHFVFRPIINLGNNIGQKFSDTGAYFYSKKELLLENKNLKNQILNSEADRANYISVVDENNKIKEILGRKKEIDKMILSSILSKPNNSPYDTLIIDVGLDNGLIVGKRVFALGNVPIGYIAEVYDYSSKVILFSNVGEKTEVVINGSGIFMQAVGRGGGNFEMILPRDFILDIGTEVDLPGIDTYILGTVENIISDPRDSFQKALLVSPVNIQELKFVEVER
ncbi:MAG: rod shape-determining protein MreC [Candidatus Paceibacterota bacterium]